ncbi:hypothetical protein GTY41_06610 [Streptomyces sp. SID685]|uniref:hypothetical protein n=1 Tax=Streptomyces sp. SID685 TaxID=2690322 RepID=UPI00136C29D0|nr:hypothetical protein [Streptomyces sp. SID685]MYR84630.1 hypothetical protein [Streptomyces sp. SID685]
MSEEKNFCDSLLKTPLVSSELPGSTGKSGRSPALMSKPLRAVASGGGEAPSLGLAVVLLSLAVSAGAALTPSEPSPPHAVSSRAKDAAEAVNATSDVMVLLLM